MNVSLPQCGEYGREALYGSPQHEIPRPGVSLTEPDPHILYIPVNGQDAAKKLGSVYIYNYRPCPVNSKSFVSKVFL